MNDTRQTRQKDSSLIVILNDKNPVPDGVESAFKNYDSNVIYWSERNDHKNIDLLGA